jgi:hypothetical protein
MSVEDSAVIDQSAAAPIQDTPISDDSELGAIWDRLERDNGAARGEGGKFTSPNQTGEEAAPDPLEGGEGGEAIDAVEPSTPAVEEVPLPSNWRGLEETWAKIPADIRPAIKAHEDKLHQTLSQQGQALSAYKPVAEVFGEYQEYFNGQRGNYKPDEAVRFLFGLQRGMDENPEQTIMQIIDTYELRPKLAAMFGGEGGQAPENALLSKIDQLEATIQRMSDPSKIDQRIAERLRQEKELSTVEETISRTTKEMPLYSDINEQDLVYFINKSWDKLGSTATQEAVLKSAYDMAINADPDLRAKAAALKGAAVQDPAKVAAAKRANETNIRSTPSGKTRSLTEDEELAMVWEKSQRG